MSNLTGVGRADLLEKISKLEAEIKALQKCATCECRPAWVCLECYRDDHSPLVNDEGMHHCWKCNALLTPPRRLEEPF